jgi:hypothetical protein
MKKTILPALLIAALFSKQTNAQTNRAFAITSEAKGSYNWTVVREIDLATGAVTKTIYNPADNKAVSYEATAGSRLTVNPQTFATYSGVAAAAYDAKHNRLYYSQMWMNELRYFDLNSNETKVVINTDANYSTGVRNDESNVITRMTFAANGNGYALTNDGNQLIQFTTGDKPAITNLGALIDGKENKNISVHNQCTSWGGDMIADVYGNLYLITYRSHVFKINIQTKVADYIGAIKGLPNGFTTNGAAVDANGNIFLTSAVQAEKYYSVNLSTLEAKVIDNKEATVYNTSDLANANLAYQNTKAIPVLASSFVNTNEAVSVYPNPAINKTFNVKFNKLAAGTYVLEITDANGSKIAAQNIAIKGLQNQIISLPKQSSVGYYLLKVTNSAGKVVYTDKVLVQ